MDKIFEKIIEMEKKANDVYQEAVTEKEKMKEDLLKEMSLRESEIRTMAEEKIKQLVSRSKKEVDEKIVHINRLVEEKLSCFDSEYEQHAKEWEDTVFQNVIGD